MQEQGGKTTDFIIPNHNIKKELSSSSWYLLSSATFHWFPIWECRKFRARFIDDRADNIKARR
jgi:hypothetical protein